MKQALNPELADDDGTFWMAYEDVIKHFWSVTVCRIAPYYEVRSKGKFMFQDVRGYNRVVSRWFYDLKVSSPTRMYIGVHQEDERVIGAKERRPYLDIGFVVLKVHENCSLSIVKVKKNTLDRQAEMEVDLPEGRYIVLPRTSGITLTKQRQFQKRTSLLTAEEELSSVFYSTVHALFRRFDRLLTDDIRYPELKALFDQVNVTLTPEQFSSYMSTYASSEHGLTRDGFVQLIREETVRDEARMRSWLYEWGYDKNLFSYKERTFVLTFHTFENTVSVELRDALQNDINYATMNLLIWKKGICKSKGTGVQLVTYHEPDAGSYNYGFWNNTGRNQTVTFDCTRNTGMLFSVATGVVTKKVLAGCYEYLLTVQCDADYKDGFSLNPKIIRAS